MNLKIKDWNWSDYAQMVKFSKSPITASLLKFDKDEVSQMAVNCFIGEELDQFK